MINVDYTIDLPVLEFMYLHEGAFDNIVSVTARSIMFDHYRSSLDVHRVYLFNMVISGKNAFRNLDDFDGEKESSLQ